jgi:hypothetical protein
MLAFITGIFVTKTYKSPEPAKLSEVLNVPLEPDCKDPVPKISAIIVLVLSALEAREPEATMFASASTGKLRSAYNSPEPLIAAAASFILTALDERLPVPLMLPEKS